MDRLDRLRSSKISPNNIEISEILRCLSRWAGLGAKIAMPRALDSKDEPVTNVASYVADAREVAVRDHYAASMPRLHPLERLVKREQRYANTGLRADMRTVTAGDLLREWEFKLHADHRAVGQILTYVALARREFGLRPVRGVIAAFSFAPEVHLVNETMNLNLDLIEIPEWMRAAGGVPERSHRALHLPVTKIAAIRSL